MTINYIEVGTKSGLSRKKAEEIAPDLKRAVEEALKSEEKKVVTESKNIIEIDNTY